MTNRFGGIPVESDGGRFGGVPVQEAPAIVPWDAGEAPSELVDRFWQAKSQGDEKTASAIYRRVDPQLLRETPKWYIEEMRGRNTDEMSGASQALAAMGGAGKRLVRGIGQAAKQVEGAINPSPYAAPQIAKELQASQEAEAAQRQFDAPLNATGAGFSGEIGANLIPMVAGGVELRGTQLAGAFLPRTFSGSLAQGFGLGALQARAPGESQLMNAGVGGVAGGGGYAAMRGLGGLARVVGGEPLPFTQRGIENSAARVIRGSANDPASLMMEQPSNIPGVMRTLAEESLDPGIAQLQRQFPQQLAEQAAKNNAVRAQMVRKQFGGADEAAIAAIEDARDAAARQALRGMRANKAVSVQPVVQAVDAMLVKQRGRPAVQTALAFVKQQLESGIETADQAYNVRKTIGDLMEGRLAGDLAAAKTAKGELLLVRGLLDRQMRAAVPEWGAYLKNYRSASRQADQVRIGQRLLDKGATATENAVTGERNLTPAKVHSLTNDRNALAQQATGFRKAQASRILDEHQQSTITDLRDDLARVEHANNAGRAVGSNTAQNMGTLARMGMAVTDSLPIPASAQRVVRAGAGAHRDFVNETVARLLANPQEARSVLSRLPPKQRALIEARLGAALSSSVVLPALQK